VATKGRAKIVILDDSAIILELMKDALERTYDVVCVDNPIGFGALLKREQPDLALVDVNMPALRGDKLVEIAKRNLPSSATLVLFSTMAEAELSALARQAGAAGYVQKSSDVSSVCALARGVAERARWIEGIVFGADGERPLFVVDVDRWMCS
jgi:DNA-binding NarL/FixJ family response regulator